MMTLPANPRTLGGLARLVRGGPAWTSGTTPWIRPTRRTARRTVFSIIASYLLIHAGFWLALDYGSPRLRDPEYGKRLARGRDRAAENPTRPVVLVIGSSRTAMGVRPDVLADDPDLPILVNMALAGSGPIMERMVLRRALTDGLKPDAVIVEYWPAFLREDGVYHEESRIDPARLRPVDSTIVNDYFRYPELVAKSRKQYAINPIFTHRKSIMNQASPGWLIYGQRSDATWEKIDDWGWLPGHPALTAEQIRTSRKKAGEYYIPLFANYEVSEVAARAMQDLIAECRAKQIPVALYYLPEAAEFRNFMPPAAQEKADAHLARLRAELGLQLIDARGWVPDDDLPDGFHLTQPGAAAMTRKLGPAVTATFPGLKRGTR